MTRSECELLETEWFSLRLSLETSAKSLARFIQDDKKRMPYPNAISDKGAATSMVIEHGSRRRTLLVSLSEAGAVTVTHHIPGYLSAYRQRGVSTTRVLTCFFRDQPPGFDIYILAKNAG